MLAKENWLAPLPCDPIPEVEYNGFPFWHALLVKPRREEIAAERFKRVNVHVYLPMFSKVVKGRIPGTSTRRLFAVISGMLFVPVQMMQMDRRDEVLDWANVRGFVRGADRQPERIRRSDIEIIMGIEASENATTATQKTIFKIDQRVCFLNSTYAAFLGEATVIDVACQSRIGVKVEQLFGSARVIYVSPAEIEPI